VVGADVVAEPLDGRILDLMRGTALLSSLLVAGIVACGGSSSSPVGPGSDPEGPTATAVAQELEIAGDRIAASEVGAVDLAFDLDDDQRQAIADAIARARAALADLRSRWLAGEIGAEATVAEARAIRVALEAEIDAVLTPEQRAALDARRAGFHAGLELTEEQRAAIRAIVDAWRALVLETVADLRARALTPREAAAILAAGAREARAAVCGVLDPEQRELFPRCPAAAPS
jgi:Spy/CpxP family protein refolding chaperone